MHRKKPFSAKQKKKQIQEKRKRKQDSGPGYLRGDIKVPVYVDDESNETVASSVLKDVQKVNEQPKRNFDVNRYRLHFFQEDKEVVKARKEKAWQPYKKLAKEELEMEIACDIGTSIEIPKRPPWKYGTPKRQLEANEERYFREYIERIFEEHSQDSLSYFEVNLETWRQLWRVLEMSDVFLIITDIRHPMMHFPPALYKHITHDLNKSAIVVFNKVDLAPPSLVVAWQHFFKQRFPLVEVVCFSSFPKNKEDLQSMTTEIGKIVFKKRRRGTYRAMGPRELYEMCQNIVEDEVDLSSWEKKIHLDQTEASGIDDDTDESDQSDAPDEVEPELAYQPRDKYKDGVLTIGCVGYPNVGKSSIINGLMGKKVVSVSKTPGHTKHFQTIYLTKTVRLCDCPGLVFPSHVDKNLQILGGIYPISQVSDPFSVVGYVAERLDLPKLLRLKPVDEDADPLTHKWSALDICESWAQKRGFVTAKAARLDAYRSANHLLRIALEGRICLCFYPTGYWKNKEKWETCDETVAFIGLQNSYTKKAKSTSDADDESAESSSEEEEEEENEGSQEGRQLKPKFDTESIVSSNPFALLVDD
ncbi:guanine nucleotide-binding protein-like 1 [Mya arenaria]|uniref:guanine nucleotide-binding protein-like 1 n=1 Tax=Mya arenaria TaxID=6604 RepID=UPI0022DFB2EC|nr:guanine nucleotide-binding protein-like 1 [Mya arenaria]XP_052790847.1 guanine nucleotide-binding protein-like 1 [Mya arenaria]